MMVPQILPTTRSLSSSEPEDAPSAATRSHVALPAPEPEELADALPDLPSPSDEAYDGD